jgi:hypothetical protein
MTFIVLCVIFACIGLGLAVVGVRLMGDLPWPDVTVPNPERNYGSDDARK